MSGSKAASLLATYLHALVLLVSLVLVPADPLFKTYENAATMALIDQAPDEPVEHPQVDGPDDFLWQATKLAEVSLRNGERKACSQDAPRASGCGRAFHARGPPPALV